MLVGELEPAALNNKDSASYIAVTPGLLRLSRHTGELFKGVKGPRYMKCGNAVRYLKKDLDDFLMRLPKFATTAEVHAEEEKVRRLAKSK